MHATQAANLDCLKHVFPLAEKGLSTEPRYVQFQIQESHVDSGSFRKGAQLKKRRSFKLDTQGLSPRINAELQDAVLIYKPLLCDNSELVQNVVLPLSSHIRDEVSEIPNKLASASASPIRNQAIERDKPFSTGVRPPMNRSCKLQCP